MRPIEPSSSPRPLPQGGPLPAGQTSPPAGPPLASDRLALSARVEPLPGGMDAVPLLNANHPEIVHGPGVSVSTLPWGGPGHLPHAFSGPFQIFTHHQNRSGRALQQTIWLHNPSDRPVRVKVGASAFATTDSARYLDHGTQVLPDGRGLWASGPGDQAAGAFLRGARAIAAQEIWLAPGASQVVHGAPLPAGNEGTGHFALEAEGQVHAAVVIGEEGEPAARGLARLQEGRLLERNPEDLLPTPPGAKGRLIFGRVSGVQEGSTWRATLSNDAARQAHELRAPRQSHSYLLVGKASNTLGTGQDQAAALLQRYPDTAHAAHGNYGVSYDLRLPVHNRSGGRQELSLHFDSPGTPLPLSRVFRGSLLLSWTDAQGRAHDRVVHVSQKAGELGRFPLLRLELPPEARASIRVRFVYPANSTPPHALRVSSEPAPQGPKAWLRGPQEALAWLQSWWPR